MPYPNSDQTDTLRRLAADPPPPPTGSVAETLADVRDDVLALTARSAPRPMLVDDGRRRFDQTEATA